MCVLSAEDVTLISHPILKKNHSYIVFGEAKIEDLNSQAQAQAAEQFRNAPQVCLQIFEKRAEMYRAGWFYPPSLPIVNYSVVLHVTTF